MTTGSALNGKPYAGNQHVRFGEGEIASSAAPRRSRRICHALFPLLALTSLLAVADEPGNLLADYEFEDLGRTWGVDVAKIERGRIESFRGVYAPLNYIVGKSPMALSQKVSVKPGADYVAGCVHFGAYDGAVSLAVGEMSAEAVLPSVKEWGDGRLFLNSGTNTSLTVSATLKNEGRIGRIFLRPRNERDPWPSGVPEADMPPEVPNGSFETGLWGYQISSWEDVRYTLATTRAVTIDSSTAAEGRRSLRIDFPEMPTNVVTKVLVRSVPYVVSTNAQYVVRFFAKADREATLDLQGSPFYGLKIPQTWTEYRSKPIRIAPQPHAGPNHSRLIFKIAANGAHVWLDGVKIERVGMPAKATAPEAGVWFDRPFKLFEVGSPVQVRLAVADVGAGAFDGSAILDVTDIDGNAVHSESRACAFPGGGSMESSAVLPSGNTGYYHAVLTVKDAAGAVVASNATTYAVLPKPNDLPYADSDAGEYVRLFEWGNGKVASRGEYNSKNGASFDETLDALQMMGVKWLRIMGLGQWFNTEIERGRYEFVFESVLDRIREKNMGVFVEMLAHGIPDWSRSKPVDHRVLRGYALPDIDAVRQFARVFARHYRGRVDAVNLINEMDGLQPEEYLPIFRAVRAGFDDAGGGIDLQGPGWELPPPDADAGHWTKRAFDLGLGELSDGFGIHQYDFGHWTEDVSHLSSVPIEVRHFRKGRTWAEDAALAIRHYKERNPGKPVWDSETGNHFNTYAPWMKFPTEVKRDWYTERLAAARMIRYSVLKRSYGVTRWFHFMHMFFLQYHALDVINIDGTPRSGVAALAVFRKAMDGARYVSGGRIGETRAYEIVFRRPDGRRIAVAWDAEHETEKRPHRAPFPAEAYDMEGKRIRGDQIDGSPVYYLEIPAQTSSGS